MDCVVNVLDRSSLLLIAGYDVIAAVYAVAAHVDLNQGVEARLFAAEDDRQVVGVGLAEDRVESVLKSGKRGIGVAGYYETYGQVFTNRV